MPPYVNVNPKISNQDFTPPFVLAHLNVESLSLADEIGDGVHRVSMVVVGRPLHTPSPNPADWFFCGFCCCHRSLLACLNEITWLALAIPPPSLLGQRQVLPQASVVVLVKWL